MCTVSEMLTEEMKDVQVSLETEKSLRLASETEAREVLTLPTS